MMLLNKKFKLSVLKILLFVFCLDSAQVFALNVQEHYVITGGPTFVASHQYRAAGDRYGVGGYIGLVKTSNALVAFSPAVFAGAIYKDKLITHLDFMATGGLGWLLFFGGVGLRTGEAKGPVGQVTYGIVIGPTTAAIRRYATSQGIMKEGLLTVNIPVYIF